jgi:DNA ligase D-like protein (predicted 3'-phosphoesterase)
MSRDALYLYRKKRNFNITPEPSGLTMKKTEKKDPIFVIQKHDASHLHYDFRLQINGTLKSWAVPKNLPKTTNIKRLAMETENHPLAYATFEGTIPRGEYGAGTVKIWDSGTFKNNKDMSLRQSYKSGHIEVILQGKKLNGRYALIRMKGDDQKKWLCIKMKTNKQKNDDDEKNSNTISKRRSKQ